MKEALIHQAYEIARERYAALGVDTEKVLAQLLENPRSRDPRAH